VRDVDLILTREAEARRALSGRRLTLSVLVPPGRWVGQGALRVLRVRTGDDESAELVAGYESYEPLDAHVVAAAEAAR
jgi:hypothetical protein